METIMDVVLCVGLGNAIGASVLALAAAGTSLLCRRPAVLHALWLLVLLKLLTPPLWPVPVARQQTPAAVPVAEQKSLPALAVPERREAVPHQQVSAVVWQAEAQCEKPGPQSPLPETTAQTAESWPWAETLSIGWGMGALILGCLTLRRVGRFRLLLHRLTPAPQEVQQRAQRLAQHLGLRRCPVVFLVAAPLSPMVWALGGQARLLAPAALWQQLGEEQRDLLLAHELAHLRRGDPWVRLLELVVVVLYWWHPVAWWARRRLQETGEQCCDAWVVATFPERAIAYATTLVDSAAFLSRNRVAMPAGASGMGHVPLLRRRVTMIVQGRTPRNLSWAGLVLLLAVAAVLLPLWPTWAEPQAIPPIVPVTTAQPAGTPTTAQAPMLPATKADPTKVQAKPSEDIVLLQAQLKLHQAQLQVAALGLKHAQEHLAEAEKTGDAAAAKLFRQEVDSRQAQVVVQKVVVDQTKALVEAHQLRALMDVPAKGQAELPDAKKAPTAFQPAKEEANRLKEMEKRIELLQKEMDALRKEIKNPKTPPPPPGMAPPATSMPPLNLQSYTINDNKTMIPFQVSKDSQHNIAHLTLWMSRDRGQTWVLYGKAAPADGAFLFHAPENGEYWLTVEAVDKQGQRLPTSPEKSPMVKVVVHVLAK
jgi:beta-lactamase regulating signal transducer with metallopeptidase domain